MTDPQTLNELFFNAIERFTTKRAALCYKSNGAWREITHQELAQRVHHTAIGLIEAGVEPGDRVAILSNNRPEWAIADFACLTARCTDVAVYPTLPTPQVEYLLRDSGSKGVFVEDREQLDKVLAVRERLPDLSLIIVFEPQEGMAGPGVVSLQ